MNVLEGHDLNINKNESSSGISIRILDFISKNGLFDILFPSCENYEISQFSSIPLIKTNEPFKNITRLNIYI